MTAEIGRNPVRKHQIQPEHWDDWAGWRRTGLPNLSRETKFSGTNGDWELLFFHIQLTTSRIGNLTQLIHTLARCDDLAYIILRNTPKYYNNLLERLRRKGLYYVFWCMVITNSKDKDQPGKVANQSCSWSAEQGKLFFPCPRSRLRIWSRETGLAVPSRVSLLILHTRAEYGAYSWDSCQFPGRQRLFIICIYLIPGLSGHALAYR